MIYCPVCQPDEAARHEDNAWMALMCVSCTARQDAAQRAEDFGPNGDATTPGFFFDRERGKDEP